MNRLIVFDLETGGLDPKKHPIIQIAAASVDLEQDWKIEETFETKVAFKMDSVELAALRVINYQPELWENAPPIETALKWFIDWLYPLSSVRMISKRTNKPYYVCRLGGYNAEFDKGFIQEAAAGAFLPIYPRHNCILQLAAFRFLWETAPKDLRLGTVHQWLVDKGEAQPVIGEAHDALWDVKAAVEVGRWASRPLREASAPKGEK